MTTGEREREREREREKGEEDEDEELFDNGDNEGDDGENEEEKKDLSEQEGESPPKPVNSTGIALSTRKSLSVEEWERLNETDPVEALQARLSGRTSSGSKPSVSTTFSRATSAVSPDTLLEELRTQVLEANLFQAIESDHLVASHIKALLQKLDTPNVSEILPESIIDFVSEFKPLLDQVANYIEQKKEHDVLEEWENKRKAELENTANASQKTFITMQAQSEAEMKELDDCQIEIKQHQTIAELQSKILAAHNRKTQLLNNAKDPEVMKARQKDAANLFPEQIRELDECKASVEQLAKDGSFLDKMLSRTKTMFANMKSKLHL